MKQGLYAIQAGLESEVTEAKLGLEPRTWDLKVQCLNLWDSSAQPLHNIDWQGLGTCCFSVVKAGVWGGSPQNASTVKVGKQALSLSPQVEIIYLSN